MASDTIIDDLLARYLGLLHEYARLRAVLAARQASMFSHLARANFAAERGIRYGPEHFDGRMQALVRLAVVPCETPSGSEEVVPSFAVVRNKGNKSQDEDTTANQGKGVLHPEDEKKRTDTDTDTGADAADTQLETKAKTRPSPNKNRDPLQWFGVLTPMALRQAQQAAVQAVDEVVPHLASISAEMAAVEIAVRRARKKRAQAEKEQQKQQHKRGRAVCEGETKSSSTAVSA